MAERVSRPAATFCLEMRGICKNFGATAALQQVDLSVKYGEIHALIGENGAGKSTLMKILAGAIKPDGGEMHLAARRFAPQNPLEAKRAGVGMIYQELSLAGHLTVEENILLGREPHLWGFLRRSAIRRQAQAALGFFADAEIRPGQKVRELSVAARQRVEIARVLATGCQVMVLDEPTSSLGRQDVQQLFAILQALKNKGHSIIYISHFIEEVNQIADRVTILRDGKTVFSRPVPEITPETIVTAMVGKPVGQLYPRSERRRGEPVLTVRALRSPKVQSADFTLHRGEVLGIAGLVGAGRTELLRGIFGLDPVQKGDITLALYRGPASPRQRWRQGAGILSENRKEEGLALTLSIAENTTLSSLARLGRLGLVRPSVQNRQTARWIEKLGIRCQCPQQKVNDLSGGNQQKVALARLLQHEVDVLLLDEPTRGIDVAAKAAIYQLIDELAGGAGGRPSRAILMISSYLPELLGVCDRIAVMHRGRLGEALPASQLDEHKLMLEAAGRKAGV